MHDDGDGGHLSPLAAAADHHHRHHFVDYTQRWSTPQTFDIETTFVALKKDKKRETPFSTNVYIQGLVGDNWFVDMNIDI